MNKLRWVVIQHPGGMKSVPVLQFDNGVEWEKVPTYVIKVDHKGEPIKQESGDDKDK